MTRWRQALNGAFEQNRPRARTLRSGLRPATLEASSPLTAPVGRGRWVDQISDKPVLHTRELIDDNPLMTLDRIRVERGWLYRTWVGSFAASEGGPAIAMC